jgi:hypothetical protein
MHGSAGELSALRCWSASPDASRVADPAECEGCANIRSYDCPGTPLRPVPTRTQERQRPPGSRRRCRAPRIGLADALSLLLLIREDEPGLYDKAAVRWFAKYASEDRYLLLRDARELIDLLDGVGRHDQVAVVRLERLLRARGYDEEADRVA